MRRGRKTKQQKAFMRRAKKSISTIVRHIYQACDYPIEGCWTRQGWDKHGMADVVVARRQPNGNLVFGVYLVDYYCLGLKDTFCNADIPPRQFHRDYLAGIFHGDGSVNISPALAHEIIYGGIEFAAQFGFHPPSAFYRSQNILDPPDLHPRTGTVQFGYEGKPFYIEGPYDNVDAILSQLDRTAGEGNFNFVVQIAGPPPDEWDE